MRNNRTILPVVLSVLAIVIAMKGTAGASTGSIVNIADGTTAANVAKVDASGNLKVAGTLGTRQAPPTTPFRTFGYVNNYYQSGVYYVILGPTNATLAVTRLGYTNNVLNTDAWELFMYQSSGTTASECLSNLFVNSENFDLVNVEPRSTHESQFETPLVFKPRTGTTPWCLVGGAGPTQNTGSSTNTASIRVTVDGYVVSGSYTPPPGASTTGLIPGLGTAR